MVLLTVFIIKGSAQVGSVVNKNAYGGSIHGDLSTGYGAMQNNKFGNSGSYFYSRLNSIIVVKGVPFNISCGYSKSTNGISKFGPFSINFSKINLDKLIQNSVVESYSKGSIEKKLRFQELAYKLADYNYLESVSKAAIRYRELCKDTTDYASDLSVFERDSLKNVLDEFAKNREEFQGLRSNKTIVVDTMTRKAVEKEQSLNYSYNTTYSDSTKKIKKNFIEYEKVTPHKEAIKYSKFQSIWSKFEKLTIGYDMLNQSIITMSSYSYAGLGVDYRLKHFTLGGSIGKHYGYSNASGNSLLILPFSNLKSRENFLQGRISVGENENKTVLALSRFRNVEPTSRYNASFGNNSVDLVSIHSTRKLNNYSSLELDLSKQINQSSNSIEKPSVSDKTAVNIVSENNLPQIGANLKIGYMNVGTSYFTPGNRYLTNSIQIVSFVLTKSLIKELLTTKLNFSRSWNLNSLRIAEGLQIKYKINSKHNLIYSFNRSSIKLFNTDINQVFLNNQVSLNSLITRKLFFNILGNYGIVQRNNLTTSKDYLLSTSLTIKFDKITIVPRVSYFNKAAIVYNVQGYNGSLSFNSIIKNKVSLNIMLSLNNTENLNSMSVAGGIDYRLKRNITFNISGNLQNYFKSSILRSYDYSTQGQGTVVIKF